MSQVPPQAVVPAEVAGSRTAERVMNDLGHNDSAWSCNET
jgi:hypothetical protein